MRDSETARQLDSETARQRDSETARQRDSETARQRDSETARQRDSETVHKQMKIITSNSARGSSGSNQISKDGESAGIDNIPL